MEKLGHPGLQDLLKLGDAESDSREMVGGRRASTRPSMIPQGRRGSAHGRKQSVGGRKQSDSLLPWSPFHAASNKVLPLPAADHRKLIKECETAKKAIVDNVSSGLDVLFSKMLKSIANSIVKRAKSSLLDLVFSHLSKYGRPMKTLFQRFDKLQKKLHVALELHDEEQRTKRSAGVRRQRGVKSISLADTFTAKAAMSRQLCLVSKTRTENALLRGVSSYSLYMGGFSFSIGAIFGALTRPAVELRRDENELMFMGLKLQKIEETQLTVETWRDYTEAWEALLELRSKILVERGQIILASIASDLAVLEGLGAAHQMLQVSGEVPQEVFQMLSEGPANHIRKNSFRYRQSIDKELFGIKRVKDIKAGAVSCVGGFFTALMIGLFNYYIPLLIDSMTGRDP